MTEKEMRRLSRAEILELLLIQTKETEQLQIKLEKAEAALAERYLRIQASGDLEHAVLEVNGVMEAAQAAARQYLDNIAVMEEEARERCRQMIDEAREEAERIRGEALNTEPGNSV